MIRPATSADAENLCAIHAACFAERWSAESFAGLLASPGTFALLSTDGFVLARVAGGEAEILSLGVLAAARRKGEARALVRQAAAGALARGATVMFLEVAAGNPAARGLYATLGFREAGIRKGYYREPGKPPEDALMLRANLPLAAWAKPEN
jgi:ribosomal-protein-alanine N-acetyltransferase